LKQHLEAQGHICVVLNTGPSRLIPSEEYETVLGARDYLSKIWRFSRRGFVFHLHVNGKSSKGLVLTLVAEVVSLIWGNRCFLTFHAGEEQKYFPRSRAPLLTPLFWLMFAIPRQIICNNVAVKDKIAKYGINADKIVPIPAFSRQYLQFDRVSLGTALEAFYARFDSVLFCYIHIQASYHPDVLIEGFARVARMRADTGLVICGLMGHREEALWRDVQDRIVRHALELRVCVVDDLDHDQFLTALSRSAVYVRTPPADGVASSVLEALALRVPVVASDNGSRPAGVVTYEATNTDSLVATVLRVLDTRDEVAAAIPPPAIADTLADEARLLIA
jgi:glycosyltransferase involved in cell wall biosynthesis